MLKIQKFIKENGFDLIDINSNHILELGKLPMIHRDPFDRILIAQSISENIPLVTKDEIVTKYPLDYIFVNNLL